MLLARGEPGDRKRAGELVHEALAGYRRLGMLDWAEKAVGVEYRLSAGR
jgi:hypothetical protein